MRDKKLPKHVIAIDWSGAKTGFRKKIWWAKAGADGLRVLKNGRSREGIRDLLLKERTKDPDLVVGLDFAFSFPAWFLRAKRCASVFQFWQCARSRGEEWLGEIRPPFFTKGGWLAEARKAYRLTEWRLKEQSQSPETVFKLVGAKQVGRGSIRGMPILQDLRSEGFRIWPFDPPELPFIVEIYPRMFYPGIVKSSLEARMNYLARYPNMEELHRVHATCSDDAFDAAVSALHMFERRQEFVGLAEPSDNTIKVEGQIWS